MLVRPTAHQDKPTISQNSVAELVKATSQWHYAALPESRLRVALQPGAYRANNVLSRFMVAIPRNSQMWPDTMKSNCPEDPK